VLENIPWYVNIAGGFALWKLSFGMNTATAALLTASESCLAEVAVRKMLVFSS
jgi:hypothetical protein